ncbi:MAG: pirin family protein [Pseudomonadales bacterium]|jgi:redox-sensitive bicupin YhaK (pirin superfamily)|nr:pirin family protein [Pseudomonadales bacterium]
MQEPRRPIRLLRAAPSQDGDRVRIQRIAGFGDPALDPFLLLDELRGERADLGGGFPPHPHRGMQTLTYLREGGIVHEDSRGHRGEVVDGGIQWMSAGRGIVHSEMPTAGRERFHGFQLWINLPAAEKGGVPRYRDVPAEALGAASGAGFRARALAGSWTLDEARIEGPLAEIVPRAAIADLELDPGAAVTVAAEPDETLLAYVYEGALALGDRPVRARELLVLGPGDHWRCPADAAGASLLLLRGRPIREPVVAWGPFVMNRREEIEEAIADYRAGRFG